MIQDRLLHYWLVTFVFTFSFINFTSVYAQRNKEFISDSFFVDQIINEFETFKKNQTQDNLNNVLIYLETNITASRISMLTAYEIMDTIENYFITNKTKLEYKDKLTYFKARIELLRGNTAYYEEVIDRLRIELHAKQKWSELIYINYSLAYEKYAKSLYEAAISLLFENEELLKKINTTEGKYAIRWHYISNANTLGICFNKKNEFQKALHYFETALERAVETKLEAWIGITSGNIGGVLIKTDRWQEGISLLERDIKISIEKEIEESAANALMSVAQAYLDHDQIENAKKYLDSCYSLFPILYQKNKMSNRILKDYIRLNGDIQFKKNNYKEAIAYYKEAIDTLYNLSEKYRKASVFDNHNRYKIEDNLIKTNELINMRQQKKFLYIIFGITGISLVIIILLMWRYSKKLKEQNNKISQQNEKLELLNQEKSLFLSILSHDLRGPMIRMKGLLSLYNNNLLDATDFQKNTKQVEKSIQSLLRMLENLLKWAANSTKDELKLTIKPIPLKNLVDEVCSQLEPIYVEKKIFVAQKIEDNIWVTADEDALGTIIRNLLNNAIKFSYENGYIAIYVSKPDHANNIRINVRDEGIGIAEAQQAILMQAVKPYAIANGTNGERGFGVGLQLCKNFISKMNGQIGVKSFPGKGSTFYIELPAA